MAFIGCNGILQLSHGKIISNKKLVIRASLMLDLKGITIEAPAVELWVVDKNGSVTVDTSSVLPRNLEILLGTKEVVAIHDSICATTGAPAATISVPGTDSAQQPTTSMCPITAAIPPVAISPGVVISVSAPASSSTSTPDTAESDSTQPLLSSEGATVSETENGAGAFSSLFVLLLAIGTILLARIK